MTFHLSSRKALVGVFVPALALAACFLATKPALAADRAGSSTATARIVDAVDNARLVTLAGHTHPLARPAYDRGVVEDSMPMAHMFVQLRRDSEREGALDRAIAERQNPHSGAFHHWLTAEEIGRDFGPSEDDVEAVRNWLTAQGLEVNGVSKNGLTLDVSGTAGSVRKAFHTEIHKYVVNAQQHIANTNNPQIPAALAPVVVGVVSLNDFMPKPQVAKHNKQFSFPCTGCPGGFAGDELFNEAPADLATIYNVAPLYSAKQPITGKGQTIAVLERSDALTGDVTTFRKAFGLSSYAGTFSIVHPGATCIDPSTNGDEIEAALDAEWAGAVAPDAAVELAACADTATTMGTLIAAQNLLDTDTPPPIMSLSYGTCEANEGPSGNAYINGLWQQAAGEGVSVFVSSGDGGAAGCDDASLQPNWAVAGIAANGLGSTPYNVAAGGTDFLDTYLNQDGNYWSETNSATGKSAMSYIPEMPWNNTCGGNVLYTYYGYSDGVTFCNSPLGSNFLDITAASGAPSFVYKKPYWQKQIAGVPDDGVRDLPDVSLFASNYFWGHAILFCMSDTAEGGVPCDYTNPTDTLENSAGGTSFVAPQLASIQALINQKAGGPQGNPNPIYYDLARAEYGTTTSPNSANLTTCNSNLGSGVGSSCVFRDITVGNNGVPCYGPVNCYSPQQGGYGLLSTSTTKLLEAYPTNSGWDFATGLGTLNVTNLVNNWP